MRVKQTYARAYPATDDKRLHLRVVDAGCRLRSGAETGMTTLWSAMIGLFLGFVFGVGCALAVMYSIYFGGYKAAVRDSLLPDAPERYRKTLATLKR